MESKKIVKYCSERKGGVVCNCTLQLIGVSTSQKLNWLRTRQAFGPTDQKLSTKCILSGDYSDLKYGNEFIGKGG